jgi:hypothetical protein
VVLDFIPEENEEGQEFGKQFDEYMEGQDGEDE